MTDNLPLDELVRALVRKLPAPGATFHAEQRVVWLKMMAMAFDVAYGVTDELPAFLPATREPGAMAEVATSRQPHASAPNPAPTKALPRFLIDTDGIARLDSGERIMPSDIIGPIYDLRGELGDLGSITWADGSRGVLGHTLDISTSV